MSITEKETGNTSKERDREGGKEEKEKRKQCATSVKGLFAYLLHGYI